MKALVDLLHLLLCTSVHSYEMLDIVDRKPDICYFYLENDIAEGYEMEDHLKWRVILENFKCDLDLATDQETLNFIRDSIKLTQEYKSLVEGNSRRTNFIQSLI